MDIEERAKKIKLVIMDVDGVLTDGRIIYDNFGDEFKCFDIQDGFGITMLRLAGIKTAIITVRRSRIVKRRARVLKINKVYFSGLSKLRSFQRALRRFRVKEEEACFIGDDIFDIPVLKRSGLAVVAQNGVDEAKSCAHYITTKSGGRGAVREAAEIILKSQGKFPPSQLGEILTQA